MLNEVKSRFTSGKKIFITVFVFIVHYSLLITHCHAQWQPDVRLTNDPAVSYLSEGARCIASSGNDVHVVWRENRDGNNEIYYKRSADGGVSWGIDTRLTNNASTSFNPSVAVSGSVVHVVWFDLRDGSWEIYYKRSTDAGVNWCADTRLTNAPANSWDPSVSVSGQVVHVVWRDFRDGNDDIYYKRSTDSGVNWGIDTRLTNNPADSRYPSVAVSGSVVNVVWYDTRDGNSEIYYKRSTDSGVNWGADTQLTVNVAYSGYPSVSVSGQVVHVVWFDARDGNNGIYYKRSTDSGVTWGADTRLTENTAGSWIPSVAVSGSVVHVVWIDTRDGWEQFEIYSKRSTDGGTSWEVDTRLTVNSANSEYPSVSVSGSVVHVVWCDFRGGNYEIYYKRDPTGNPIGIINISSEISNQFSLSQNYPNPFNPSTKIQFALPKSSFAKLVVLDAIGREVSTLVNEELNPGTYEVDFDGTSLSSGIYYYKLTAGDYVESKKMLMTK